ncbi:MAG: HEAT repeat domain-containing protein [Ilumatobacteraceae bacterium]
MTLDPLDAQQVMVYFAERDRHVAAWREAGGAWQPFGAPVPVAAMQSAALHASAKVRREALGVLDHFASDESTNVFRSALDDPVPRVRLVALHGLSCERCRFAPIGVGDVVTDVLRVFRDDVNAKVRHAAIDVLCRFVSRDPRVLPALRRAAVADGDEFVRIAADGAAHHEFRVWTRKAVRRRHCASSTRHPPGAVSENATR